MRDKHIVAFLTVASLAACAGGSSGVATNGSMLPSAQSEAAQPQLRTAAQTDGKAVIVVKIPHKALNVQYVSPSTKSMMISVTGAPKQTFNLGAGDPGCATKTATVICREVATLPLGEQIVLITLYDGLLGKGHELAAASTWVKIEPKNEAKIPVTLEGVPATAIVSFSGSAKTSVPAGAQAVVPVTVNAYDADDNLIVSPGNYATAVTLTDSDKSGATKLSSNYVNASGEAIQLTYTGAKLSSATVTPFVKGAAQAKGTATLTISATPASPSPAPSAVTIKDFPVNTSYTAPEAIVSGPNNALWFTQSGGYLQEMTTSGTLSKAFPVSGADALVYLSSGTGGGTMWFTAPGQNALGRMISLTAGTSTTIAVSNCGVPYSGTALTGSSDGAVWFLANCNGNGAVGRMTTSGAITEYTTSEPYLNGITTGPDGAIWFTEDCGVSSCSNGDAGKVGRITTDGKSLSEYLIPINASGIGGYPNEITPGPDGALWFTGGQFWTGYMGRVTTSGVISVYPIPLSSIGSKGSLSKPANAPGGIAPGPDGALWFTIQGNVSNGNGGWNYDSSIGRIDTTGSITEYSVPLANAAVGAIAHGPDGALWFTEDSFQNYHIGRLSWPNMPKPETRRK